MPSLDGLRAVAVLIVLVGHLILPSSLVGVSALGLKIFFVLSGFLITRLLLAEMRACNQISLGRFYARRIIRLYPVLVFYVVAISVFKLLHGEHIDSVELAAVFLYYVNYLFVYQLHIGAATASPIGHLWSLSVEEHFYLIVPVIVILLRGRAESLMLFGFLACAVPLAIRLIYAYTNPDIVNTLEIYWRSETRFDSIAFGLLLACFAEFDRGRRVIAFLSSRPVFLIAAAVLIASFGFRDPYFQNTWRFTVQGLAMMSIVAGVVFAAPVPMLNLILNHSVSRWVGGLSYSLYIWQFAPESFLGYWLNLLPNALVGSAMLASAFVFAIMSYSFIEKPFLELRRLFNPKSSSRRKLTPVLN